MNACDPRTNLDAADARRVGRVGSSGTRVFGVALLTLILGVSSACADFALQREVNAARGRPADPDEYEILDLVCSGEVADDGFLDVVVTIENTGEEKRLFELDLWLEMEDGDYQWQRRAPTGTFVPAGETDTFTTFLTPIDGMAEKPGCKVQVLDSALGVEITS